MGVANTMIIQELQRTVKSADEGFHAQKENERGCFLQNGQDIVRSRSIAGNRGLVVPRYEETPLDAHRAVQLA